MSKAFFVVDTNGFISANLIKNSNSARALDKALLTGKIALSDPVLDEYTEVLYREKLDKYLNETKRQNALKQVSRNAIIFSPVETVITSFSWYSNFESNRFLEQFFLIWRSFHRHS